MRKLAVVSVVVGLLISSGAQARVTVERTSYRGWADSYRLTAGSYSLVVVPEIGGRIMEYSLEGRNVIWENAEEFGRTYPISGDWRNYGGYKTWASPQDVWGWPPDFLMDAGKANVEVLQDPKGLPMLKVVGAPSLKMGIVFIKEITLRENGEVVIKQRMRNIGRKSVSYGIWDVTQVRTPCFVVFPVNPKTKFSDGLNYLMSEAKNSSQYDFKDGYCIVTYLGEPGDIASDSPGPWMIWFKDDLAYVKLFGPAEKGADYPDSGCTCEVFTSDRKLGYVEMEILGPVVELQPGAETELTGRWQVFKLSQPVTDANRVLKAIAGMKGKKWIP